MINVHFALAIPHAECNNNHHSDHSFHIIFSSCINTACSGIPSLFLCSAQYVLTFPLVHIAQAPKQLVMELWFGPRLRSKVGLKQAGPEDLLENFGPCRVESEPCM